MRAGAPPHDLHANLAHLQVAHDVPPPQAAERDPHEPTAVGIATDRACRDVGANANEQVAADPAAAVQRVDEKRRHAIEAIGQQQDPRRQVGEQPLAQGPLRFAGVPDAGGERIVPPHFEQDGGGELGKRGASAARAALHEGGQHLRRVRQTELRAVEGDEPPVAPKRVRMPPPVRAGAEHAAQQLDKQLPGQAVPAFGPGTVGQRRTGARNAD